MTENTIRQLFTNPRQPAVSKTARAFGGKKEIMLLKVIELKTGNVKDAIYLSDGQGNMRIWIDGKFYTDTRFDKLFKFVQPGQQKVKVLK